jgi:hypothetical protein
MGGSWFEDSQEEKVIEDPSQPISWAWLYIFVILAMQEV